MPHVTSADGTSIGYDRLSDDGPTLVLVGGGLDDGTENIPLGEHLAGRFGVVNYRRRGRGDSGDNQPYAVEREIEDLAAVIDAVGGRAHLFGASSGGALAFEAAAAGLPVDRIAVHEVPYQVGDAVIAAWQAYRRELDVALDAGDWDQALRLFIRLAGSSAEDAEASEVWPALRALAPTLRYDAACLDDGPPPAGRLAKVSQPALLTTGIAVAEFFDAAAEATAAALPDARRETLPAEGHVADPAVLGPVLSAFYLA
ncbi:alpha/beta fold hydrolase [Actinoplanes bogorensis]|uniref:Alpha/beta fold hydrolase n=1 Tax=Paractinoplanes bogorensis TaxID=1610840 RepID=A0ABS5YUJ5_9ACTN|nr:alpha/beta fold hydrolase [Actinoplanes bogorensis]MBU2667043.1 alpha/beta fold hydrolase [Actinoplanes bogorensis]